MATPEARYRFGEFDLDARTGELRREGARLPLPRQAAELLRLLVECPGEVVTREVARRRLWPDGTHVDYDHGLNNAAARLRRVLGDRSDAPRFVETLPRIGYRFVHPVVRMDTGGPEADPPALSAAGRRTRVAAAAAALFAGGMICGAVWATRDRPSSERPAPAVTAEARDQAARSLAYTRLVLAGDLSAAVAADAAGRAAERALALDPTLADAHVAAGYVAMWGRWDWVAADRLFRAAIVADATSWRAHEARGVWLSARARHGEALSSMKTARALNPASPDLAIETARLAFLAGHEDLTIATLAEVLAAQPDEAAAHDLMSRALDRRGDRRAAAVHFERYLVLIGVEQRFASADARVLADEGFEGLTRWYLSRPSTKPADRYGMPFKLASSHALAGDYDTAIAWLERARDQRDSRLLFVNVDPRFAALRADPRFQQLLREVGL